jgi:hypothetical protein
MALTSKLTPDRIELEHEPGEWIEIKPVSWMVLRDAKEARVSRAIAPFVSLGPEGIAALQGQGQSRNGDMPEDEHPEEYDRETLLRKSVIAWSYDQPVTEANIDDLDDVTAKVVYKRAVALNTRSKSEGEASTPG